MSFAHTKSQNFSAQWKIDFRLQFNILIDVMPISFCMEENFDLIVFCIVADGWERFLEVNIKYFMIVTLLPKHLNQSYRREIDKIHFATKQTKMTTITDGQVGYLFIGMEQRKEDEEEEKKNWRRSYKIKFTNFCDML